MVAYNQPNERYRELQVMSASPLQRTLMVYDAAIVACGKRDLKRATDALNVLRNSLDLTQGGSVASGLFRLYLYCGDLMRAGQYDQAADILRGLVQAWVAVLVKEREAKPQRSAQVGATAFAVAG